MNIETLIAENTAALKENTAVLREVLAAGGAPTNVTPITEAPKPAKKKAEKVEPVKEEPAAVVEPEPEIVAEEAPDIVIPESPEEPPDHVFVAKESSTPDPEALIASIIETFKAKMTSSDNAERKGFLKTQLPVLRAKWGLGPDDKLAVLTQTPEKLVVLLADIEAL